MSAVFLAAFLAGLLIAVFAMLHGVERRQLAKTAQFPQARVNVPLLAAFLGIAGATGYLLTRYSAMSIPARLALSFAIGITGAFGAVALVTKWALPSAARDPGDPRYALQGHLAQVTQSIDGNGGGEIRFVVDGVEQRYPARSIDSSVIAAPREVVIERLEDGVAWVEPWTEVEQRL